VKRLLRSTILSLVLVITAAEAQWKLEPSLHALVLSGIDLILKQEYDRADSLFCEVAKKHPYHPAGFLYQAAVMQAYAIDVDVPIGRQKFDSLLERGKMTAAGLDSPWREFFLATADGYDAFERVERGDWLGGIRKAMASASTYEQIVQKDSSFYDAYIGIGTYQYWRSRKTAFIRWLPFVRDDRELGIKMLIAGAERSEYSRSTAISALISIYLDAEKYQDVEKWAKRGLDLYPENRVFLWGLATALDRQKHSASAIEAYSGLLENILHAKFPHPYSEIVCRLNLSKSLLAVQDTASVAGHLSRILSYEKASFPSELQSRAQAKFDEAKTLLFSVNNHRKDIQER